MHAQTKINIQYIEDNIKLKKTLKVIGSEIGLSRAGVSSIICTYLPHLRKSERKKEQLIWARRSDLEREQRQKVTNKRANARHTGHEFTVKYEDIRWPTHCPILGLELDYFADTRQENSVSFDRIDNSKGYNKGNVQIVSWRANRIKNDGTADEHRKIADYLDQLNKLN